MVRAFFPTVGWKEVADGSLYMGRKMIYTVYNGTGILIKEYDYE